ncbi:T9SS type A sorting domain-containing protein [Flavobacterium sp. GCM10023249]|uniref:T9SS type A sorting domain-containing protein n=1 Tax=unclassified Flavobacterium TaxID=196869 RepID=UPI00361C70A0
MKKIYLAFIITLFSTLFANAQIVISQVYGSGNNAGATYQNDFIEIFNRGSVAQDLTGWSVQYASATGTAWAVTNLTSVVLQPGQYYLIQEAGGTTNGSALPTPDATGTINMSGSNGKVILVNVTTAQTGTNPTGSQIIDKVGFGSTPNGFEGQNTGVALTNTTSATRLTSGCTDTDNNANDFVELTPSARNTATTLAPCSSAPDIVITTPTNGTAFSPETTLQNVDLFVANFNVANGTGDGHIHYTVNGGPVVMKYDTTPIIIPTTPGSYTVYVELVDNAHNPIVPAQNATVTFTVSSYNNVSTIAAARAVGVNNWVNFTGEALVSFTRTTRNQKYVQDATAGILIDDNAASISTPFIIGDGISSLRGQIINFNGVLELVPNQNATKPSTGNTITPQLVTANDIVGNIDAYESELVRMNGVTFTAGDGNVTFIVNTDYATTDPNSLTFRTLFSATEVDYIGTVIPVGPTNFIGIVSENNGVARITARSLSELTLAKDKFDDIAGLQVYPNPAKTYLNITSDSFATKNVEIYDVLGKMVVNTKVTNSSINVSGLTKGVYVVKINEEGKTATRKLVIE